MKRKETKNPLYAAIFNFIFWGLGYLYLEKKADRGFYAIATNILIWIFTFWYISVAGLLLLTGLFWIIFWYLWISIYFAYDAYRTAKERK